MASRTSGNSAFATANGVKLHYLEFGVSPADIIVVPGITSPAMTWEWFGEALANEFHIYVLDVRGRGLSDKPSTGYRLPEYAADLAGLVKELGLRKPIVLGHSMGARIAAAFGVLYADLCGPLILIEPPLSGPGRAPYPTTLDEFTRMLDLAKAGEVFEELRRTNPKWSEQTLRLRANWLGTCDRTAVMESHRGFHEEDFFDYWSKLTQPIVFMCGKESSVVTSANLDELRISNTNAEFFVIPEAAHMIPWDNPTAFLQAVRGSVASFGSGSLLRGLSLIAPGF